MELVVRKNDLLRELQLFQGIVERKNTIPILANVLMEAKGDSVSFLATDLEVGLRSKCNATISKGGKTFCRFDDKATDWKTKITGSCSRCKSDHCTGQFMVRFDCSQQSH